MSVSREEVVQSYRTILGRDPESEFAIQEKIRNFHSLRGLVESLSLSEEFRRREDLADRSALLSDCQPFIDEIRREVKRARADRSLVSRIVEGLKRPFIFSNPADNVLFERVMAEFVPRYWRRYTVALLMMLVAAGATSMVAYMIGGIVNATFLNRSLSSLVMLSVGWVLLFVVRGLASYGQDVGLARASHRITAEVQKRVFGRLLEQGVGYFAERRSAEFMANAIMGAGSFGQILNLLALALGRDVSAIVFLVGFMVYQSPVLAVFGMVVLPLALMSVEKLALRARELSATQYVGSERILGTVQEVVHGFRVVKAFRLEDLMRRRVATNVENLERASNNLASVSNWSYPMIESFAGIAVGIACFYAGYQVLETKAVPGEFVSFMLAFIMLFEPSRRLARLKIDLGGNMVMAQALYQLFDTPAAEAEGETKPALKVAAGRIEFADVDFAYIDDTPVLDRLSFVAEAGRLTALVGLSGGGKTTTFNLLLRFWNPTAGRITIDGQEIGGVSLASLRDAIAYVGQDVYLFGGTIRENILLGRPNATEAEVIAAAKAAYAHDFIAALPRGYDAPVGEFGAMLSQGQRQRISIARALLKDAPIVLLDEPTASLDAESEHYVQLALRGLCAGKTTLAIAHRLNTVGDADRILVLESGRVVESGSHDELIGSNGRYATFYNLQFGLD